MKAMVGSIGTGSVLVLAGLVLACGGDEADAGSASGPSSSAASDVSGGLSEAPEIPLVVDPATVGSISGTVVVAGTVPPRESIKMLGEAFCLGVTDDGTFLDDRLIVTGGKLSNAFVWVTEGLAGYDFEPRSETVTVDQRDCLFTPKVLGVQLGQQIVAANSDGTMHNVHTRPERNRPQNFGLPPGAKPKQLKLRREEVMIEVVCDVHAWMKAWIGVLDHPFFDVTDVSGAFRLEGLPPGDYKLGIWHEQLGRLEVEVTVGPSQEADAGDVSFQL